MAIKLVTEVMDHAPPLTHREHKVLIILAENARLPSREIWDSIESPQMLRRVRLTRSQLYAVIAALVDKGCLESQVWGGRNHRAKYAIAKLPLHDQCPGFPDTENHDQRPGLQDTERPRSVSGKPGPRLFRTTGRFEVQAEGSNGLVRSKVKPTPPQSGNPPDHDGPTGFASDDQHTPTEVHLQSQATGGNARARCAGCGQPIPPGKNPSAIYCDRQCKNAATKRRSRRAAKARAS